MDFAAVLVMAGSGVRLGGAVPKAFVEVAGQPLWRHAARTLAATPGCRALVLVAPAGFVASVTVQAREEFPDACIVAGGARRQDSVRAGLEAVPEGIDVVAVHDAARPLVTRSVVEAAVREAADGGAALVAVPVRDTVKRVRDGRVVETLDRSTLWQAQTPQAFRIDVLRRAHESAAREAVEATDDSALVERLGLPVSVVRGDPWNLKVTERDDLGVAEALLRERALAREERA